MDRRITPRSPRAALEPEHVPVPTRRSKRARNPLVIIGNAIFTLLILLAARRRRRASCSASCGSKRRARCRRTRSSTFRRAPAWSRSPTCLQREGVIDEHRLVFIGGVFALKARAELKSGEYLFPKRASVRDVVETMVEGKVVQHLLTIPEGLTSEQIVARLLENQILTGNDQGHRRARAAAAEQLRLPARRHRASR